MNKFNYISLYTSEECPLRCEYCHDGDTPILLSNLTWKPIKNLITGEEIVGVRKNSSGRWYYCKSKILNKFSRQAETIILTTDKGSTICTPDHKWLRKDGKYREAIKRKSRSIKWISAPQQSFVENEKYRNGWLKHSVYGNAKILKIEDGGTREVFNIETETGNYIASGMISKNCFLPKHPKDSNIETLKKILDWFRENSESPRSYNVFGTEPLYRWDLLKFIVDYSFDWTKGRGITSNCVLLTKNRADYLVEMGVGVLCSIDVQSPCIIKTESSLTGADLGRSFRKT